MNRDESKQRNIHDPYEIMDLVLKRGDAAKLGANMNKSPQAIRNWCRPPETKEEFESTGRPGPLQRTDDIIDFIILQDGNPDRAHLIAEHICRRVSGLFIPVPEVNSAESNDVFLNRASSVMKETGEAIEKVRSAWCDQSPERICRKEFQEIIPEIEQAMAALHLLSCWVRERVED